MIDKTSASFKVVNDIDEIISNLKIKKQEYEALLVICDENNENLCKLEKLIDNTGKYTHINNPALIQVKNYKHVMSITLMKDYIKEIDESIQEWKEVKSKLI